MSTQPGDLRLLLRLMEGTLPPPDRATLRERFASDRELRQRWEYLNNLPSLTAEEAIRAEQIPIAEVAAYIDGTLPSDTATQFEARSWNSPAMLAELVSMTQSNGVTVPDALTTRLTSLMPPERVAHEPLTGNTTDAISASTASTIDISPEHGVPPLVVPELKPASISTPGRPRRRASTIVLSVAAAVCVAALGWFVWSAADKHNRQVVRPERQPKSQDEPLAPKTQPRQIVEDQQVRPAPGDSAPIGPPAPKLRDMAPPSPERGEPTVVSVPNGTQPEPLKPTPDKQKSPANKPIDRLEVRGLVVARLSVRDTWRGLKARDVPVGGHYATFPGSRAIAAGAGDIELVVDEQSEFAELAWGDMPGVRVLRGRVAFRNLPDDTRVRFVVGDEVHDVMARRNRTTISLDLRSGEPRIGVHTGVAAINKNKLEKHDYYLTAQAQTKSAKNIAGFDRWLGTWQASVPIDPGLLAELSKSNNIRRDLSERARAGTLPQQQGDRMLFVVAPQARVHRLLVSKVPADHDAAVRWLAMHSQEQTDLERLAWKNIRAVLQGNPNSVESRIATMRRWLKVVSGEEPTDLSNEINRALRQRGTSPLKNFAGGCLRVYQSK